ncbi:MAG: pre-16S rRNA-processing nuclease YqgF [Negativicutes bacterium]
MTQRITAVDPGREKCGVAVVDREQGVLWREVADTRALLSKVAGLLAQFGGRTLVLGDQTASAEVRQSLQTLLDQAVIDKIVLIDEHGSTEAARVRYWQEIPPTGWRKLIPLGLLVPPCAVDDFAAIILAERYFKK